MQGAFTFQVGRVATAGNLQSLSERLLANQGGDNTVGFLYAIARFGVFASLALLIGAAAFLVLSAGVTLAREIPSCHRRLRQTPAHSNHETCDRRPRHVRACHQK